MSNAIRLPVNDCVMHDNVWIHLYSKPDWYLELYPVGKVPLLITKEGKTIVESDAIIRYLDETIGSKSLMSLCGEAEFERAGKLVSKVIFTSSVFIRAVCLTVLSHVMEFMVLSYLSNPIAWIDSLG
ncbi:hypothetical protein FGIG_12121 [Fasciola gigantica]|uniref:GST N-terminal domain-containing protein n=1 Tax=Fasciola gigantica TaxID=46835 RepID=A0A504YBV5_FASGI|nr:hypothetical protein FGIG_12121 [Fasciola gigantica]